ncbi:AMP-binding protein [Amycolatopsis sp. H6(2020)]|nr:AMP-binding protein [Amycolatopsis sp. H6(2020)]
METRTAPERSTGILPALILRSLRRHADRVLVEDGGIRLCGTDLADRIGALASRIGRYPQPPTVVVQVPRDARLVVAVAAAAVTGARLVLIDEALPAIRRCHMMQVAVPDLVVLGDGGGDELPGKDIVRLERDGRCDTADRTESPDGELDGGYVFFTSGSTGWPKAVLGRWQSVAHFVTWQCAGYRLTPRARFGQLTGVSFDVILRELLAPLVCGATICFPERGRNAVEWMRAAAITHLNTVPSLAASWLRTAGETMLPRLEWTWFGGETLSGALVRRWQRLAPLSGVTNFYGPTETALAKFAHDIPAGTTQGDGIMPVGFPLPGTAVRIADREVVISTWYGTRGYLDAPAADHARFTLEGDECQYRTGDLGRLDEQSRLCVLGRADRQIKVDGVRVEPEGVAAAVAAHPEVDSAYVDVRARHDGGHYLACFYTTDNPAGSLDDDRLRDWLSERLDRPHVPSVLRRIGELPLAANGKVDARKLPKDTPGGTSRGDDPATAAIREAFGDVLGVPVGADADFGRLGGTSLTAVELAAAIAARTHRATEVADVFRCRTPRRLAAALAGRRRDDRQVIPPAPALPDYPLAPEQRRYFTVYLQGPNRSWNTLVRTFVLPAGTTKQEVDSALTRIVARHDPLRAFFRVTSAGEPRQQFAAAAEIRTVEVPATDIARLRRDIATEPIDIGHWPLFRAWLSTGSEPPRLLWAAHHLIADGESQNLFGRELTRLIRGHEGDGLPALPVRYRDYAWWAARRPTAEHREYWREVYRTPYQRILLPRKGTAAAGRAYRRPLSAETVTAVENRARQWGVTAFSIVAAAFVPAYRRLYERDDLSVAVTVSGRRHPQTRDLLGMFAGIVTLRHRFDQTQSFRELAGTVQHQVALGMTHQDCQFDEVLGLAGAEPDADRFPLTTALITAVDLGQADATDLSERGHRELGQDIKWDIAGHICRRAGELAIDLHYRGELLEEPAVELLAADIATQLERGLASPETPYAEIIPTKGS